MVAKKAQAKAAEGNEETNKNSKGQQKKAEEEEDDSFLDLNIRPIVQIPKELADGADSDTGLL